MVERLQLEFTPQVLDEVCQTLSQKAASAGHLLAALHALETFLAAASDAGVKADAAYAEARRRLGVHLEAARGRVEEENATSLAEALLGHEPAAVARVHRRLSRSGFQEVAQQALHGLEPSQTQALAAWADGWWRDAKARGEAASGYPDALDLAGAGIVLEEYAAMGDLRIALAGEGLLAL